MSRNPILPYQPYLKPLARKLRKNMTLCEILLWQKIRKRKLGVQFHRQVPIKKYIVDFYCHELRLAVEVDGSSHNHPEVAAEDLKRQEELEKLGVHFLRFEDSQIISDMDGVVQAIYGWIRFNAPQ